MKCNYNETGVFSPLFSVMYELINIEHSFKYDNVSLLLIQTAACIFLSIKGDELQQLVCSVGE